MAASHGEVAGILSTGYWSDPSADNRRWSWSNVKLTTSHPNRRYPSGSGGFIPPDYFWRVFRFPSAVLTSCQTRYLTHSQTLLLWVRRFILPGDSWVFILQIIGDCLFFELMQSSQYHAQKLLLPIRRTRVNLTSPKCFLLKVNGIPWYLVKI